MSEDNFQTIAFSVRKTDYVEFERITRVLYQTGKIKQPKVSVLAKTFLYVMSNQFKDIEAKAQAIVDQAQTQLAPQAQGAPNV